MQVHCFAAKQQEATAGLREAAEAVEPESKRTARAGSPAGPVHLRPLGRCETCMSDRQNS
eukprot:4393187-Amphidinium_carterae.1